MASRTDPMQYQASYRYILGHEDESTKFTEEDIEITGFTQQEV